MSEKKVALVTGANKGIGFEVARGLGKAGMTVLLAARDEGRGREAAARLKGEGLDVREIALDLGDEATIRAAAEGIEGEFGRLDALVNNAGIGDSGDGPTSKADLAAIRRIYETNLFGTVAVTQAMLPLVRKSAAGRIVNVSSSLGSLAYSSDPDWESADVKLLGYNSSKAALNMMTVDLAYELRGSGIKVNAANPGLTATDLTGQAGHPAEIGAEVIVRLALLPEDGPTGGFFEREGPLPW